MHATTLAPTFSSPLPPSLPVISVRDAVYEYETVGTLHSQTHADTQDTVEHQTRQKYKTHTVDTSILKMQNLQAYRSGSVIKLFQLRYLQFFYLLCFAGVRDYYNFYYSSVVNACKVARVKPTQNIVALLTI